MTRDGGILPTQRLWTPWRMAYVGGGAQPGCVFCDALAGSDDVASLIVHRGERAFVMLNLFPYNTGHLMVIPNVHVNDLAALDPDARAEIAELTAAFCTGLRRIMRCDGLNTGMNLGSAAGAGIAEHLHQHIVPRWVGDANFMPLIGGTKVLPELIPATYAKIRAEVARERSGSTTVTAIVLSPDHTRVLLDGDALPEAAIPAESTAWEAMRSMLAPLAATCELLAWGGPASTAGDGDHSPVLVAAITPRNDSGMPWRWTPIADALATLPAADAASFRLALGRLGAHPEPEERSGI